MEESILIIIEEMHARLSALMSSEDLGPPPKLMRKPKGKTKPKLILIGPATQEQRALAILYSQVYEEHDKAHELAKMPFGNNPHVDFDHFRHHVMMPSLLDMLEWSVHREFPEQETNLNISFDSDWNMYAPPDRRKQKSKKKKSRS